MSWLLSQVPKSERWRLGAEFESFSMAHEKDYELLAWFNSQEMDEDAGLIAFDEYGLRFPSWSKALIKGIKLQPTAEWLQSSITELEDAAGEKVPCDAAASGSDPHKGNRSGAEPSSPPPQWFQQVCSMDMNDGCDGDWQDGRYVGIYADPNEGISGYHKIEYRYRLGVAPRYTRSYIHAHARECSTHISKIVASWFALHDSTS